jgi:hypothetical protein
MSFQSVCQFIIHSHSVCPLNVAEVTSVSKAIGYELRSMQGRISLCYHVQTACAANTAFYATSIMVSLMSKAKSMELTTHPHLVSGLTIRRALPPLRHTSLRCDSLILNVCARLAKHYDDQIQRRRTHGRKEMHAGFWYERLEETYFLEDERIILTRILQK